MQVLRLRLAQKTRQTSLRMTASWQVKDDYIVMNMGDSIRNEYRVAALW
jgi:hypothetical protein